MGNSVTLLEAMPNDELPELYNSNHFYVSNSIQETSGVVIIEAMSCGLPVLSTKSGGPEEIITEKTGKFIEDNSLESLVSGLNFMIDNYKIFDPEYTRLHIVQNYSEQNYRDRIDEIYKNIIGKYA